MKPYNRLVSLLVRGALLKSHIAGGEPGFWKWGELIQRQVAGLCGIDQVRALVDRVVLFIQSLVNVFSGILSCIKRLAGFLHFVKDRLHVGE
jgi:hypothetical protein